MNMHHDLSNTVLAGKYRIESLIGRGGMGSVWRAQHLSLRAPVAIKLMDMGHFGGDPMSVARFQREALAAASIRSANVVQIFDHGFDEALGVPFIVMELMAGESLAQRLARTGPLTPAEVAQILTHVARALARAHEAGIVHRDLKPDNVFLVHEDELTAKVLDFGIAKAQAHELGTTATVTGALIGTAYYMSPEQISGSKNVDYRSDIWAYGVMACECLTGVRPFEADNIGGLTLRICVGAAPIPSSLGTVPAGFDAWFARCTQRLPEHRFQSAREAAEALRPVCVPHSDHHVLPSSDIPTSTVFDRVSTVATDRPLVSSSPRVPRRSKLGWVIAGSCLLAAASGLALRTSRTPPAGVAQSAAAAAEPSALPAALPAVPSATASTATASTTPTATTSTVTTPTATAAASSPAPARAAVIAQREKQALPSLRPKLAAPVAVPSIPSATKPLPTRDVIDDRR